MNSLPATVLLFERRYMKLIGEQGLDIATHLTPWRIVADIDVNYQGAW